MKDSDIYFVYFSVSIADFSKLISVIFSCSFCSLLILDDGGNEAMDARIQERWNNCFCYNCLLYVLNMAKPK